MLVYHEFSLLPDGKLHLHVFDVGQGDAMMLVSPSGKQILIDGGPNTELLTHLGEHMSFFDRTIELVVLTHPDADHVTALPDVLRRYKVDNILLAGVEHHSGRYEALLDLIAEQNVSVLLPDPKEDIVLGDNVVLDIIWPKPDVFGHDPKNVNDTSVVMRVLYGNDSILLAGDIEEDAETAILQSGADIRADVLKVPHHGSKTSSSTGFVLAVAPELAVVSAGRNNRFGHPHTEVLNRYAALRIPVLSTANEGSLSLEFNGK